MATNFSVTDAGVQAYVRDGGVHVSRYRRMRSAVMDAVAASGGKRYPGLAPVDTSIPVTSGQADIQGTAESAVGGSNSYGASARATGHMSLLVQGHGDVERTTAESLMAQLHGASTTGGFGASLVADKLPAIMAGFDAEHLAGVLGTPTDVEWDASAPAATISTAFATYDETAYNGDAMIVTRKGARLMGLAVDGNGNYLFNGPLADAFPVDIPVLYTDATATDIGTANLLAVIGPFGSCAVGESGSTKVDVFDQLEATGGGAAERIVSFLVQRYMGFASPATSVIPASAWTTITDDV